MWHLSLGDCSQGEAVLPCLISGQERGTHSLVSAQCSTDSPPPPRSVPQEPEGEVELARSRGVFGTQSIGGRALGFPSSSSFVFRRR